MSLFFISYTKSDQVWAEWISWQLEKAGHSTIVQSWDFEPGANFVMEMQNASKNSDATIAVLSKDYLEKTFPSSEWAAAFVQDPSGIGKKLIPVRISDVKPNGLLASIVYIDLFKAADEESAVSILINGVTAGRKKPKNAPPFPVESRLNPIVSPPFPISSLKNEKKPTVTSQRKKVEIRINRRFEEFSATEQEKLLSALQVLLSMDEDIKIVKIAKGSVLLTVDIPEKEALKLVIFYFIKKLDDLNVTNVVINGVPISTLDEALAMRLDLELDQPKSGRPETGVVIFENVKAGYGILERDLGGYLKFKASPDQLPIRVGEKKTLSEYWAERNLNPQGR